MSKSNVAIFILILVIIGFGIFVWGTSANKGKASADNSGQTTTSDSSTSLKTAEAGKLGSNEIEINANNFDEKVVKASNEKLVLVDIYAPWCPHCQNLSPVFTALSNENKGKVVFGKMNGDYQDSSVKANYDFVASKGFEGYPTVWFYKNEKLVYQFSGEKGKAEIQELINKYK